jgi:hypothetical protein
MHRSKLIAGSVAVLALSATGSSATGSCNSNDRSQSQCGSQTASTKQKAVAISGELGISSAFNESVTLQYLKQRQRRGFSLGLNGLR